jgi:hypothetical protein
VELSVILVYKEFMDYLAPKGYRVLLVCLVRMAMVILVILACKGYRDKLGLKDILGQKVIEVLEIRVFLGHKAQEVLQDLKGKLDYKVQKGTEVYLVLAVFKG